MRHLTYYLTQYVRECIHLTRHRFSPTYREHHALGVAADMAALHRECWANDQAQALRLLGHDVPVGTVLAGVTVTR